MIRRPAARRPLLKAQRTTHPDPMRPSSSPSLRSGVSTFPESREIPAPGTNKPRGKPRAHSSATPAALRLVESPPAATQAEYLSNAAGAVLSRWLAAWCSCVGWRPPYAPAKYEHESRLHVSGVLTALASRAMLAAGRPLLTPRRENLQPRAPLSSRCSRRLRPRPIVCVSTRRFEGGRSNCHDAAILRRETFFFDVYSVLTDSLRVGTPRSARCRASTMSALPALAGAVPPCRTYSAGRASPGERRPF